ncbi:MAG: AMP-binding protein [Rhodospirillales bacterium]
MNPFLNMTYSQSIAYIADKFRDREAVVYRDQRFTYADIKREIDLASARFASLGLKPGDKVAILLPNRPEFIWSWLGASQMGLVAVMINTRLRQDELSYQLAQSDTRAVIIPGEGAFRNFLDELSELAPAIRSGVPGELGSETLPALSYVLVVDDFDPQYKGALAWSSLAENDAPMPEMESNPETASLISYSSGTTALPKGAMISHCVWRKAYDIGDRVDMTVDDCLYMAIPMFGSMAILNGVLPYLARGAKLVIGEQFDADKCLAAVEKEKVTAIHLLPPTVKQIVECPNFNKYDRSSLKISYTLSIDPYILDTVADVIGIPGVMTGYGLTETTTVATRNRWDDPREIRHTTQGWALPDVEIKVVNPETLEELPANEPGELWVRGYCVMLGYYKKPKETEAAIRPDGWFRTGDMGKMDSTGRVQFLGRLGDGYKSRGFNVSPEEVEFAINQHPSVYAAAVIGVPDPVAEKIGAAFIIKRKNTDLDEKTLLDFLKPKLSGYKMPKYVFFVDDLPLTPGTGKVQKFKLRELAADLLELEKFSAKRA